MILLFSWLEIAERSLFWSLVLRHENRVDVNEDWADDLLVSNRKFHKVKIDEALNWKKNNMLDIFKHIGAHIQELLLFVCVFDDNEIFIEFLKAIPNLKRLILCETASMDPSQDLDQDNLPLLGKLEALEMMRAGYPILATLQKAQLITFKVLDSMDGRDESPTPLLNFLGMQKKLKTLALRSICDSKLFETPIMEEVAQFKLKTLSLQGIKLNTAPNEYNNLLRFMKLHSKTIEELDLGRTFPDFFYEFVFAKFKNLKKLRLMVSELPTEADFFDRLEENKSVTSLSMVESSSENWTAVSKELFKHVPNVENLSLTNYCENETLEFIASNLKQLKNLTLISFNGNENIQFPALTSLKILESQNVINWNTLTTANSGIIELILDQYYLYKEDHFESITCNLKQLRSLTIGSGVRLEQNFFDLIHKNCSQMKSLRILRESVEEERDYYGNEKIADPNYNLPDFTILQDRNIAASYDPTPEGDFWSQEDYSGRLRPDDFNWPPEEFDPDFMDPFDLQLMMEDLELEIEHRDDFDGVDDNEYQEDDFDGHDYNEYQKNYEDYEFYDDYESPEDYEDYAHFRDNDSDY